MTESSVPDRRTISNVVLTLAVVGGLILSYFLAIPFLPAIVWSVTLGVLFAPLDARLRRSIRSATISAAATVAGDFASAAILTFWGTIVVGLVDNVVYPILVGRKLMMHTVPSFIAIVGGVILWGAPGVVLGPLVVSISLSLIEIWKARNVARIVAIRDQEAGDDLT